MQRFHIKMAENIYTFEQLHYGKYSQQMFQNRILFEVTVLFIWSPVAITSGREVGKRK